MAFKVNYRAAQGQAFRQAVGGGYLLDQAETVQPPQASTFYPTTVPVRQMPVIDTADFGVSILGDYEPASTGTPGFRIGRVGLAFAVSQVSTTACNPSFTLKKYTGSTGVAVATFNLTATAFPVPWQSVNLTGTNISNGTLVAGDMLVVSIASNGTGQVSLPAWSMLIDIEA